jgi:hypothetical protein
MGKGESESTNESEQINISEMNIDEKTLNNINQKCNQVTSSTNLIQITGSKVKNLTVNQTSRIKTFCQLQQAIKQVQDANVKNDLLNKVAQHAESKATSGLFGGNAKSTTHNVSKQYNRMKNSLSQTQINNITEECILQPKIDNIVQIMASEVEDSNFDQTGEAFLECIIKQSGDISQTAVAESKVANEADQVAKATSTTGLDFGSLTASSNSASLASLGTLAGPVGMSLFSCLIVCIVIIISISIMFGMGMMSKGSGGGGGGGGGGGRMGVALSSLRSRLSSLGGTGVGQVFTVN